VNSRLTLFSSESGCSGSKERAAFKKAWSTLKLPGRKCSWPSLLARPIISTPTKSIGWAKSSPVAGFLIRPVPSMFKLRRPE